VANSYESYEVVSRSAGAALVTLGVLLVLTQPLLLVVRAVHRLTAFS
jgi:hypothetical protein